jgi:hypothetical protein
MSPAEKIRRLDRLAKSINVAIAAKTRAMQSPGTATAKQAYARFERHVELINAELDVLRTAFEQEKG